MALRSAFLGQAPVRTVAASTSPAFASPAFGAPNQQFHNVKPAGVFGSADEEVGSFLAQEGDSKGALLLGDVTSLLGSLGATVTYKDYDTKDGYVFRRFADAEKSIVILKSPRSAGGQRLSPSDPKTKAAWAKVTEVLDAMDAGEKPPPIDPTIIVAAIQGGGAVAAALLKAAPGGHKKKKHKKQDEGLPVPLPEPPSSSVPWVPLAAGGAALILVLVLSGSKKTAAA